MDTADIVIEQAAERQPARKPRPDLRPLLAKLTPGHGFFVPVEGKRDWVKMQVYRYSLATGDTFRTTAETRDGKTGRFVERMADD